ncbi:MAG: hypothetical protein K2X27_14895 [Candidatus Obscuribacterales bacterium]|nr:hypothetical protein [Candidatus Obscuribacterales bacterium]
MNTLMKSQWREDYKRRLCTADEAVKSIKSGDSIYVHSHGANPTSVVEAMVRRAPDLRNITIRQLMTMGNAPYAQPEYAESFRVSAFFIGPNIRQAVNEGRADYMPISLSEIPCLISSREVPVDVCLLQVSKPDEHGYCSYGVCVEAAIAARKAARVVIAEVNEQMPRTLGRSFVHVSKLTHIIEVDRPIPELKIGKPTEDEDAIGRFVAGLVEDEATIQLGIGAIPNAVLSHLHGKKNLGVHSEMLSDGIIDLIEEGVITNDFKTVLPGKVAVSFVMGSKRLYDFIDNNPLVEFQTCDFINDPYVISRNHKMTSINSALQVDLTGQVVADSIGTFLYSGIGGQEDFIRGATRARGGKAIIALPSTAKDGAVSRITACFHPGSGVVTTRADVHYVVTEFGVAQLYGKTVSQRVDALIGIAHPKFRDLLREEARIFPWYKIND